jgi:hypothetical protein
VLVLGRQLLVLNISIGILAAESTTEMSQLQIPQTSARARQGGKRIDSFIHKSDLRYPGCMRWDDRASLGMLSFR